MSLATADRDARPSGADDDAEELGSKQPWCLLPGYESAEGKRLGANPYAALGFYSMDSTGKLVSSGKVEKTSRAESQTYFRWAL